MCVCGWVSIHPSFKLAPLPHAMNSENASDTHFRTLWDQSHTTSAMGRGKVPQKQSSALISCMNLMVTKLDKVGGGSKSQNILWMSHVNGPLHFPPLQIAAGLLHLNNILPRIFVPAVNRSSFLSV